MQVDIWLSRALVAGRVANDVELTSTRDGNGYIGAIGSFPNEDDGRRAWRIAKAGHPVSIIALPLVEPDNAAVSRATIGYLMYGALTDGRRVNAYTLQIKRLCPLRTPSEYSMRSHQQATVLLTDTIMAWVDAVVPEIGKVLRKRGTVTEVKLVRCEIVVPPVPHTSPMRSPMVGLSDKPITLYRERVQFCGLSSRDPAVASLTHLIDHVVDTDDLTFMQEFGPLTKSKMFPLPYTKDGS